MGEVAARVAAARAKQRARFARLSEERRIHVAEALSYRRIVLGG